MASKSRVRRPPDHYATLGIARGATFREIEAAYWDQARRDENRDSIALLNEAYEVLGDKHRRDAYDAELASSGSPAAELPQREPPTRSNPELASKLRWYLQ